MQLCRQSLGPETACQYEYESHLFHYSIEYICPWWTDVKSVSIYSELLSFVSTNDYTVFSL